jgi:hypothetical protein
MNNGRENTLHVLQLYDSACFVCFESYQVLIAAISTIRMQFDWVALNLSQRNRAADCHTVLAQI